MILCIRIAWDDESLRALLPRACWEEMLDALDTVTPLIEDARPGLAFLDMGKLRESDSILTWIKQTRSALARFEIPLYVGVASNAFCAHIAALTNARRLPENERLFLAPLPIELLTSALDVETTVVERLRLLGVTTLGKLAKLPHGPFVRRFGKAAARWHDCVHGIDRRPFVPRGHAIAIEASLFGEGRADDETQVFFALRLLLTRICDDLARCGKRTSALSLELELDDGDRVAINVPLALPTADERSMFDVLRAKFEGRTFASAITGLRLQALRLEEGGESLTFFPVDDIDPQNLVVTLARLEAILGEPVRRAKLRAAYPLEKRFTYEPFELQHRPGIKQEQPANSPSLVPQLQLLPLREISVRVRDGAPHGIGDPPRPVVECAGPWRIDDGWFSDASIRDEYDVLLEDGTLHRIYHQERHWYLRGTYD